MRKIIIVGTLHAGLTPEDELKEVLEKFNPDQVLVEIIQKDIDNKKFDSYPSEMIFAYKWANNKGIKVRGFDYKINVLKEKMTEEDNKKVIEEQKELIKKTGKFDWKDMNKEENLKLLKIESAERLVDPKKEKKREIEMLENINKVMISKGVVVIITGVGHLGFFRKNIKDALFPFR